MKNIDGVIRATNLRSDLNNSKSQGRTLKHWPVAVAIILVAILINSVTLLSAFEAHVVNVTATIERRPSQCDALSPGYWRNHEGCNQGGGESIWAPQINTLSNSFSGVFAGYDGAAICAAEWQPNCPSALTREGRLCRAKLHTLADELNLVSGHLDLNALIAGADRGGGSFDRLDLSPSSTIAEALTAVEAVIARHEADITLDGREWLVDASQVAERIYSFYEDENPIAPQCIFNLNETTISNLPLTDEIEETGEITAVAPIEDLATSTVPIITTEVENATTTIVETIEAATTVDEISTTVDVVTTETPTDQAEPEPNSPADETIIEDQPVVETVEVEPAPPPQPEADLPVAEEPAPIEESVESSNE